MVINRFDGVVVDGCHMVYEVDVSFVCRLHYFFGIWIEESKDALVCKFLDELLCYFCR